MNIVLCSEKDKKGDYFIFEKTDERFLHITKILKLKNGDFFKAGLINSNLGMAHIKDVTEEKLIFEFNPTARPSPLHPLHLILGIPRPIQLKRLLKDVSTIGISSIHLVGTVLGEKSYITSSLIANNEIERHLIEGATQAGSTLIPSHHIYPNLSLAFEKADILNKNGLEENVIRLLFDVEDTSIIKENKSQNAQDNVKGNSDHIMTKQASPLDSPFADNKEIVLAIGSERGWVRSERELFKKHNFATVTLGHRIMRCETATIVATSYVLTKIGWNACKFC